MKPCPFCAEEIQDAAIRCKHCRSDLLPPSGAHAGLPVPARRPARPTRRVLGGLLAVLALVAVTPVLVRSASRALRSSACQPASWGEWHAALRRQCLDASYVCQHMTTPKMLEDPELFHALGWNGARVADVVGRMRDAYGCAPERAPAFQPSLPEPGPLAPPAFPPRHDTPRDI